MAENLKKIVLERFLENAGFDGWTLQNLENSTHSVGLNKGLDGKYHLVLFPHGLESVAKYFVEVANEAFSSEVKVEQIQKLRFSERVVELAQKRIELYHKLLGGNEGFKKFISYCVAHNLLNSIVNIAKTSDEIMYLAGDKSVDFSYYTKRLSLSAIYLSSAVYSLSDDSENLTDTKDFITQRVADLLKFNKIKQKVKDFTSKPLEIIKSFGVGGKTYSKK